MTAEPTQQPATTIVVELRCPTGPRRLLAKYRMSGEAPKITDNLMELSCRDCTKNARQFDASVTRIVHRFDLAGELVESVAEHG
jgi:hypothetical protein